ncbi:MAG: hypothetical protein QW158_08135 [Nitrososphaerales archaeon]
MGRLWLRNVIGRVIRGIGGRMKGLGGIRLNSFSRGLRSWCGALKPPWSVKQTGRRGYPAKGMALLKTELKMDYRSISSYLKANPDQLKLVELDKAPGHTAIRNALSRIPESYLKRLNDRLVETFKKGALELIAPASPPRDMKHGSA